MRDGRDCKAAPYSWVIDDVGVTTERLRDLAIGLDAAGFGVTTSESFSEALVTLREHRASGMSGPLHFTYDEPLVATNVETSFSWARRIVVFAHNYLSEASPPTNTGAMVGRFATDDHYKSVRRVAERLKDELTAAGHRAEILIDDNRLVDRAAATRAGLGWIGKSTMVLTPGHGPWMLLGSVVTDADLQTTPPMIRDCGTCVACIPACPTGAISEDGLDARRCLSTWLQTPGSLPRWIRPLLGRRIYGCDDCLTSCPPGGKALEDAGDEPLDLPFVELLEMGDEQLLDRFSWWYVPRRDGRFIRRNLLVAAGNSGEAAALDAVGSHLTHRSSMIRSHAAWALARGAAKTARRRLIEVLDHERAPEARKELALALVMIDHPGDYEALLAIDELTATSTVL
ncbi:MAG: epoxyqueuosine reductase [Acidimicrobiia bacterium]